MAIFKSQLVTQISGSVGGTTYAHNAGGMYMRARSIPVQPNTSFQLQVKNVLTTLVNAWTTVLTLAQRNAWNLYAANVPVINALGESRTISGQNWYIAANTPRLQEVAKLGTALARVDAAPIIFNRGLLTTPTAASFDVSSGTLSLSFTNTDPWAIAVGGALLVYMGRPQNVTHSYFRGPWRLIGVQPGAVVPPTPPLVQGSIVTNGFAYAVGQAVFIACAATTADGRLSTRQNILASVVA